MEVKSIFVNNILKTYEKTTNNAETTSADSAGHSHDDKVKISDQATKRLFGEMMEHRLNRSLNEEPEHESE